MMYHCTPSELAEQKGEHLLEMLRDLRCANWEGKTANFKRNLRGG